MRRALRSRFFAGAIFAVVAILTTRFVVNETVLADWLVAPLLLPDSNERADAIVVLGAGVVGDCTPNLNGMRRALLGARLWREGRAPVVLFSGGAAGGRCPVSVAMANIARETGVPDAHIRLEMRSTSTRENASFAAQVLQSVGARRLLIVTDRLHLMRAVRSFAQVGFSAEGVSVPIYEGHADNVSMLRAGLREYLALSYYGLRKWTASAQPPSAARGEPFMSRRKEASESVVVLGASYATGWTPARVGRYRVVNLGVAGQQSFEMSERFDRDVVSASPRAVILWGFINDIFRADGRFDAVKSRIRSSYRDMIDAARRHGIEPILATEVTVRPQDGTWWGRAVSLLGALRGKESYQDGINRHVLEVNGWLVDTASKEGVLLLDFQAALGEPGGRRRREFTQPDGSHVTEAGYAVLSSYALPIIEAHLESTTRESRESRN